MDPTGVRQQLQAEALRRFGGQVPSGAGIPGGAATANANPGNPLSTQMPNPTGNPPMPSAGNPFAGASGAMNGATPTGGTHIEKALIKRMNMYPPL